MASSGALFGSSLARNQSKNLVEFKAGKMTMKGKMVHPDKRKGLVYVYQSDDSLMHFCWKDRSVGTVEDDLIIFPDDCEFKRVDQCNTGRVYVLKFKSSNRKFFFWLQEPKIEKDEENCKKINEVLNNPPTAGTSRSGGTTPDSDLQNLLGSMSQQQLMQLFGSLGTSGNAGSSQLGGLSSLLGTMNRPSSSISSSSRTAGTASASEGRNNSSSTSSSSKPGGNIQLSDLHRFLSAMNETGGASSSQTPTVDVDLSEALFNAESIQGVLNDPSLVQELTPHLPDTGSSSATQEERLKSTLSSTPFQQALKMFNQAFRSGQLGPVIQQFQVGENAISAANKGNLEEFVKALENTNISKKESDEEVKHPEKKKKTDGNDEASDPKDDKDDDKMNVD